MLQALFRTAVLGGLVACYSSHSFARELTPERRAVVDAHALAAPAHVEKSSQTLAHYLTQPFSTEREKLRAIYRWIADRVTYDVESYLSGREVKVSAEEVLARRISVCEGYASLFSDLAGHAGLKVQNIPGHAKGFGAARAFASDAKPNHMWTAVHIDGEWRMIDTTWGAGYVDGGTFKKVLSEAFFLVPPEQLAFTHYPVDHRWQLQKTPKISLQEFNALPHLPNTHFNQHLSPFETWDTIKAADFEGTLVHTFDLPVGLAKVSKAPLHHFLKTQRTYAFVIDSQHFTDMAFVQGDRWIHFDKSGNTFSSQLKTEIAGDLMVLGKPPNADNYVAILRYTVQR